MAEHEISATINRAILHQAESDRLERIREKFREEALSLRRQNIKQKIDETQQNYADKVFRQILPSVIEIIAETEARDFIIDVAKSLGQETCSNSKSNEEIVNEIFSQILLPEIEKRIEMRVKPDETIRALVGSHDAFKLFMANYPYDIVEEFCKDLIDELLNKIEI